MNRQIGAKNFIQVVVLNPPTKDHVIQRMCNPKIAMATKMCPAMQYCEVITNPRWQTSAIFKIAKSPYLSEKSSDFDKIWYTKADIEPDDSHVTNN